MTTFDMPKTPITFRLSDDLIEAIDAQVKATGSNRTIVVVNALKQFFGLAPVKSPEPDVIQNLLERVAALEQVKSATALPEFGVIHKLTERMTHLSQQVASLAAPAPQPYPDMLQSFSERLTHLEQAYASRATALDPDVIHRLTERMTAIEQAMADSAAVAESDSDSVLLCNTKSMVESGQVIAPHDTGDKAPDVLLSKTYPPPATDASMATALQATDVSLSRIQRQQDLQPTRKDTGEWLTAKEAFRRLGGDPDNPASVVTSLDGTRSIKFNRFKVLTTPDYKAFGLEFSPARRSKKQPCFRLLV